MNCKEFKKYLTPKSPTLYPHTVHATRKDAHSLHHDKWIRHMFNCQKCTDAYMKCSLQRKRVNVRKYSCVHIPYHLHSEDKYLTYDKRSNDVGIVVPDGGSSYIDMKYCFWCGKKIVIKAKLPNRT